MFRAPIIMGGKNGSTQRNVASNIVNDTMY